MVGLGVASFGHVNGVNMQNADTWETYSESVVRDEIPLRRAYRPTPDERFIRELVLQLKLGSVTPQYFRDKLRRRHPPALRGGVRRPAERRILERSQRTARRAHAERSSLRRRPAAALLPAAAHRHPLHVMRRVNRADRIGHRVTEAQRHRDERFVGPSRRPRTTNMDRSRRRRREAARSADKRFAATSRTRSNAVRSREPFAAGPPGLSPQARAVESAPFGSVALCLCGHYRAVGAAQPISPRLALVDVVVIGGGPAGSTVSTLLAPARSARRAVRARALSALSHRRVADPRNLLGAEAARHAAEDAGRATSSRSYSVQFVNAQRQAVGAVLLLGQQAARVLADLAGGAQRVRPDDARERPRARRRRRTKASRVFDVLFEGDRAVGVTIQRRGRHACATSARRSSSTPAARPA